MKTLAEKIITAFFNAVKCRYKCRYSLDALYALQRVLSKKRNGTNAINGILRLLTSYTGIIKKVKIGKIRERTTSVMLELAKIPLMSIMSLSHPELQNFLGEQP